MVGATFGRSRTNRRAFDLRQATPAIVVDRASAALRTVSPGEWIGIVVAGRTAVRELICWSEMTGHALVAQPLASGILCWLQRPEKRGS